MELYEEAAEDINDNTPMEVTVKHLESHVNARGFAEITESGPPPKKPKFDKWAKYALCLTRHYDQNGNYQNTMLQIKSPYIKNLLKNVIKNYPGISFDMEDVKLQHPAQCMFHYRDEIKAEVETLEGDARAHGDFFVQFIADEFEEVINEYTNLLAQGLITYEMLWTIFKPGILLYTSIHQQPHCFTLIQAQRMPFLYSLKATQTDFDGKCFGASTGGAVLSLSSFPGPKKIAKLPVFPLAFHPAEESVRELLVARGRRFEELARKEFLEYEGIALGGADQKNPKLTKYHINGRVYIDAETFFRINLNHAIPIIAYSVDPSKPESTKDDLNSNNNPMDYEVVSYLGVPGQAIHPPPILHRKTVRGGHGTHSQLLPASSIGKEIDNNDAPDELIPLTDMQCLTATALVRGFDFSTKKWLEFAIPNLKPIVWNEAAFSRLVLPASQKKLVHSLALSNLKHTTTTTSSSSSNNSGFDDVIKGKGQGLVLVLHGPPGSGKTLTAEATAELTHRPLYAVSSGELGTEPHTLELKLSSILDIASTWRCILLFDEADVFLEKRSLNDLHRNALVSIFLRLLEYYTGILFLTTNRVRTFDPAFQSRIHVALRYEELGQEARKSVWRGFLGTEVDESGLEKLSERKANGREIKNAVKTWNSLVEMEEEEGEGGMGSGRGCVDGLMEVLDMRVAFESDFSGPVEVEER